MKKELHEFVQDLTKDEIVFLLYRNYQNNFPFHAPPATV